MLSNEIFEDVLFSGAPSAPPSIYSGHNIPTDPKTGEKIFRIPELATQSAPQNTLNLGTNPGTEAQFRNTFGNDALNNFYGTNPNLVGKPLPTDAINSWAQGYYGGGDLRQYQDRWDNQIKSAPPQSSAQPTRTTGGGFGGGFAPTKQYPINPYTGTAGAIQHGTNVTHYGGSNDIAMGNKK